MDFTIAPLNWQNYSEKTIFARTVGPDFTIGIETTILGDIVTLRQAESIPCHNKTEKQFKTVDEAKTAATQIHEIDVQAFLIPATAKETVLLDIKTLIDSLDLSKEDTEKSML